MGARAVFSQPTVSEGALEVICNHFRLLLRGISGVLCIDQGTCGASKLGQTDGSDQGLTE